MHPLHVQSKRKEKRTKDIGWFFFFCLIVSHLADDVTYSGNRELLVPHDIHQVQELVIIEPLEFEQTSQLLDEGSCVSTGLRSQLVRNIFFKK